MDTGRLTVFFEGPFWVGVFERISDGKLSACKVIFGAEPRDCEVWDFILKHYDGLRFSPAVAVEGRQAADHPRRRQRSAREQLRTPGIGTKSQQALQMQREERKTQRRQSGRERQRIEKQRKFEQKRQKRKEKHRGR